MVNHGPFSLALPGDLQADSRMHHMSAVFFYERSDPPRYQCLDRIKHILEWKLSLFPSCHRLVEVGIGVALSWHHYVCFWESKRGGGGADDPEILANAMRHSAAIGE